MPGLFVPGPIDMISLHAKVGTSIDHQPLLLRVSKNWKLPRALRNREAILSESSQECEAADSDGFGAVVIKQPGSTPCMRMVGNRLIVHLPEKLFHIEEGDILKISPRHGEIFVLYRKQSHFNSLFVTERCNSYCVMCSQPPREVDDDHLVTELQQIIPLMAPETVELGITGGEPTLLGTRLIDLVSTCKNYLPQTSLHMLSNGRLFNYLSLCEELKKVNHPDLMIGIPVYSDLSHVHDFVVQAEGAFVQTMRGILNLARCGIGVEIRIVLHRYTVERLPSLCRFIARNLPFVRHVALMGLEQMGFTKMNIEALWIDPMEYRDQIRRGADILLSARMNASIYNHQLCTLDRALWPIARQSISDWKREFIDDCAHCTVRDQCCGFFFSTIKRHSTGIHPITSELDLSSIVSAAG